MASERTPRVIRVWGGFVDGTLHVWPKRSQFYGDVAVYASRRIAREQYQDVRRIEIREVANGGE